MDHQDAVGPWTRAARGISLAVCAALLAGVAACDSPLDVDDPDVVTPDILEGPEAVERRLNGMVGDFQEFYDGWALYTGLFTDEFILAGTFPTRIRVDRRDVQSNPENASLNDHDPDPGLYEPLHQSVRSADGVAADFREALDDPEFSDVVGQLREGIALGELYGAYLRTFLAEGYCHSIVRGESAPMLPDDRAEEALALFQQAETSAEEAGLPDVADAARVGQGRALMWLGRHDDAADAVSEVPDDLFLGAEYSSNTTDQFNEIYALTVGDRLALRWTVGDGDDDPRENEEWLHLDEWVDQGLIDLETDLEGTEIGVDVALQLVHTNPSTSIPIATGWEARMIEAEAALRADNPGVAEGIVNDLLTSPGLNPLTQVNPNLELGDFEAVDFDDGGFAPETDLPQLAKARAAGNWMSGQRQGYFRRWRTGDGVDLYPDHQPVGADDISFPITQQEIDNNDAVGSACP